MDLRDATRMVMAESASYPELLRVSRHTYDEVAAGRSADHSALSWMLNEAARKGLIPVLERKHGQAAVKSMVTTLAMEIDRQAPVTSY
ncbi:hypothetical protein [Actinomadura sp. 9N407]|uniref:hypothetical protein n=1 Tax=Actinomadura sp. 9N407 TaxID=3375154 RepID=UPI0037AB628B